MTALPEYEVYAVKYAERQTTVNSTRVFKDPHDAPIPTDYSVWAIIGAGRTYVVDLGFDRRYKRGDRFLLRTPAEALAMLDIDAARVEDVIVSHMHYDHCGSVPDFPKARLHIQDAEMAAATGRFLKWKAFRYGNFVEYTVDFVRALYDERVEFTDGDGELAPGITVHRLGGHTHGMQVVRVWTRKGWLVLASDAVHMYANMDLSNPYPAVFHVGDMLEGFRKLKTLAATPEMIIPGHDPLVMERFPAASAKLEGVAARLD
jgi:glyoxylase-like metal-dependent hydrolase (beta-lactamase superfamily II)